MLKKTSNKVRDNKIEIFRSYKGMQTIYTNRLIIEDSFMYTPL